MTGSEWQQLPLEVVERKSRLKKFSDKLWSFVWRLANGKPEAYNVTSATGWDPSTDFLEYDSVEVVDREFLEVHGGAPGDKPFETHKSSHQVIDPDHLPTLSDLHNPDDLQ